MDLFEAREVIREADRQMAALFERRMAAAREIAAYKKERGLPVLDPEQEKRVLERNAAYMEDGLLPYYLNFLQNTMAVSRQYQEDLLRLSSAGDRGAAAEKTDAAKAVGDCGSAAEKTEAAKAVGDCGSAAEKTDAAEAVGDCGAVPGGILDDC